MHTSDFDYTLPPELIAQEPLPEREASRMLVLDRNSDTIEHKHVRDLPGYLHEGDALILNDTRVIPARLFGHRTDTGGKVEVLLIECHADASHLETQTWEAFYRASRPARRGLRLSLGHGRIEAEIVDVLGEGKIQIRVRSRAPLLDVLQREGFAPVPPYIKRERERTARTDADLTRYQTVYAREPGAVAAPTAGLHFSNGLLNRLRRRNVATAAVTLHVGPGTFRPVKTERVEDHHMESERFRIGPDTAETIAETRRGGGRVVAVGSTCVRALETAALDDGSLRPMEGRTELFITPPFRFRIVDALLTNFHLPRSTLLMMVCAFGGTERVLAAYRLAVEKQYRFYSYGDCMLIL